MLTNPTWLTNIGVTAITLLLLLLLLFVGVLIAVACVIATSRDD